VALSRVKKTQLINEVKCASSGKEGGGEGERKRAKKYKRETRKVRRGMEKEGPLGEVLAPTTSVFNVM
jgi:hypothetical protein